MLIDVQDKWARDNPKTTAAIGEAVAKARTMGMPVYWVRMNLFSGMPRMAGALLLAGKFNDVAPEVRPLPEECIISKPTTNAFTIPTTEMVLKWHDITNIVMAGFMRSKACVFYSAVGARMSGFKVSVIPELTANYADQPFDRRDEYDYQEARIPLIKRATLGL